jgi:HAD superfamily hydrolase (TIGR01509 family)
MQPIKALIFDCDGTLVDSEIPGLDVLYDSAREEGLDISRAEAHERFRGVRMAECIAWIAAQLPECSADFAERFLRKVRQATTARFQQGVDPLPGAGELLGRLQLPFCVATNGPREKVEMTLAMSGLRQFMGERIFSAYEVGMFKPDPGLFLHAAAALGVAPEYCAVVEDSLPGIQAGLVAGMTVFALYDRQQLPEDIAERVICIRTLGDLDAELRGAGSIPGRNGNLPV